MEKNLGVSATLKGLVDFFYELNSNADVRAAFLENPLEVLDKAGVVVEEDSREEIVRIIKHLKEKYKDVLWTIPVQQEKYHWDLNRDGVIYLSSNEKTGIP